jgi:hypothetical protein
VVKSVKEIDKVWHRTGATLRHAHSTPTGAFRLVQVMSVGNKNRKVGVTDMNARSSRSHAIFVVNIECSEVDPQGEAHIR